MRREFTIRHDGTEWIAENGNLRVSGRTLEALDGALRRAMREKGLIAKGEKAEVFMAFDNATIPQWIRQYAQHYFNRIVELEG